jgi:hypothetical protein
MFQNQAECIRLGGGRKKVREANPPAKLVEDLVQGLSCRDFVHPIRDEGAA